MRNKELEQKRYLTEREYDLFQARFKELEEAQKNKQDVQKQQDSLNLVLAYFNKLIDKKRSEIKDRVVNLVSYGLQTVFKNPSMHLVVKERLQRNQKFYTIAVSIDGVETESWMDASGGVRDMIVFMFRIVFLAISSNRRFLVLDEPFKGLSKDYRENLGEFIIYLSEQFNVQFLIVSHQTEIDAAADALYEIRKVNGDTMILPVTSS